MKPGDRKKRWRQTAGTFTAIFVVLGALALVGIDGGSGVGLALFFFSMAALEMRDFHRGWPMKEGRPPWADRFERRERFHRGRN